MKIKNIGQNDFEFEGIKISAGEIVEVDLYIGQKLLALYWHNPLEPVEEEEKIETEQHIEEIKAEEQQQEQPQEIKEQPKQENFVCDICGKTFTKKVGLVAHKRFCKNKYGNN